MNRVVKKIIGKWRIFWKLCPQCNSDAPELYTCPVCNYDRESFCNMTEEKKLEWWNKYKLLNNL